MRAQYAPLFGTRTRASRGTSVPSAASTENVPLPCIGTQTYSPSSPGSTMCTRSRQMLPVIWLNDASQEPQSRSIACLVASDVVSGPGVSRIGSLPRIMQSSLSTLVGEPPGLGAPDEHPFNAE